MSDTSRRSGSRSRGWSRRWIGRALLALAAVIVAAIGLERSIDRGNDFDNFYDAGRAVWTEGTLLLEKGTLRYPPTFQVFLSPLGALPLPVAASLWLALTAAAYACLPWAFARLSGTPPGRQGWAWFLVAPFLVSNVTLGQNGPLLLALSTLGVLAAARGRALAGGFALAWAGLLKVFPGALLAVPLLLRQARGTLAGALLAVALAAAWVSLALGARAGLDGFGHWLHELRHEQTPQQLVASVRSLRHNNQGLAVTLVRSLTTDFAVKPQLAAKGSVQVASLPVPLVWGLYYAVVAGLGAALATCAWRARRAPVPRTFLGLYALAIPAMLALSPVVWTHYFLWWLPAAIYLAERRRLLAILGSASLLAVFSTPARGLGFHMGVTLLLFVLVGMQLWRETDPTRLHRQPLRHILGCR